MVDAGEAFRRAFAENDSPEAREEAFEEATGNELSDTNSNTGGGGGGGGSTSGDDTDEPAARGPSPSEVLNDASGGGSSDADSGGSSGENTDADRSFSGGSPSDFYGTDPDANNQSGPNTIDGDGQVNTPDESGPMPEDQSGGGGGGSQTIQEPAGLQSGTVGGQDKRGFDDSEGGGVAEPEPDRPQSQQGIGPRGVGDPSAAPADELDSPDREFDPDATQTAAAEARDDEIGRQARQLEQELAGRQISSLSDDLKQSGAQLREEDIAVEVRGEGENRRLEATLSDVGQERVEFIAEGQQQQAAERQIEKELNRPFASSDVTVTDDGEVEVSQRVEDEAAQQRLADETGFRESEIRVDDGQASLTESGQDRVRSQRRQQAASQLEDRLGLEQGDDFTVQREVSSRRVPGQRGQGKLEINLTDAGEQKLQGRELADESPIASDLIERGASQQDTETGEAFGGRGRVEEGLRGGATLFRERVISPAAAATGDAAAANPFSTPFGAAGAAAGAVGGPGNIGRAIVEGDPSELDLGETRSASTRRAEAAGFVEGGGELVNAPGLAVTGIEAGEFGVAAGNAASVTSSPFGAAGVAADIATGDGPAGDAERDFLKTSAAAGALTAAKLGSAAKRNPARVGSQFLGSTVGSAAVLGGAARIGGPRTTKAAATAIQPGEELAISAARSGAIPARLATKVPGVSKQQVIPKAKGGSGDPLVDIEIEGSGSTAVENTDFSSSGDSSRLSAAGDRVSANVRSFVGDERGQLGGGGRQRTRQKQRQRQQQEPVIEVDVENDPLVRARQRTESAQESQVRSDIETRTRADTRLRSAQRLEAATVQDAAQTPTVGVRTSVGAGLRSLERSDTAAITEPTAALESGVDLRSETATEARQDTRAETRQETRQDLATETAVETRAETRTDVRTELRSEADGEGLLEEETLEGLSPTNSETVTERFEYNIASPEDVLNSEL